MPRLQDFAICHRCFSVLVIEGGWRLESPPVKRADEKFVLSPESGDSSGRKEEPCAILLARNFRRAFASCPPGKNNCNKKDITSRQSIRSDSSFTQ